MQNTLNIGRGIHAVTEELSAEQLHGHTYVFFAIFENLGFAVILPATFANVLGDGAFVDAFPTLECVGARGRGQILFWPAVGCFFVNLRTENVRRSKVRCMQVEDVSRKPPTQHLEAGHLGPRWIGDEERIVSDVERGLRVELITPLPNGAHVLEMLVQLVRHHTQHIRKITAADFIFEVRDDDPAKVAAHYTACLPPIRRSNAGWSSLTIMRPAKALSMRSESDCSGHFGSEKE